MVVGGGPTGVEFSGELFDFLQQDVKRYYPRLAPLVRTKLLQSGKGVLETFDKTMQVALHPDPRALQCETLDPKP